jgi:hypothetical protein
MPCNSGPSDEDRRREHERVALIVAMLCAVCRRLGAPAFSCHPALEEWFAAHDSADRRRIAKILRTGGGAVLDQADIQVLLGMLADKP